ncbi:MAG: CBS domain-containing protein, partial [Micrococcales bacterium]
MITELSDFTVGPDATLLQTIEAINKGAKQIALVADASGKLLGTVTDGDIRRGLLRGLVVDTKITEVRNQNPHTATLEDDGREVMTRELPKLIHQVPVVDAEGKLLGMFTDADLSTAVELSTPVVLMAGGKGVRL